MFKTEPGSQVNRRVAQHWATLQRSCLRGIIWCCGPSICTQSYTYMRY